MTTNHKRFAGVRVLIFDLDGTLIDSKLDLAHAVNAMLAHLGREAHVHETIFSFIGDGAAMLVRRALGEGVRDAEVEQGLDYFLKYYRAHMLDNTVAYPGVREALAELAGDSTRLAEHPARVMAVLTNKPVVFSRAILDGLGLSQYFRFVYGGNSFERKKPDPMGVEVLLRDLQASPRRGVDDWRFGRGHQDSAECWDICVRSELRIWTGGFARASAGSDGG